MNELLSAFPVVVEIPVAWGEMDAFQHVNNVVYFRYFETGRIAYFERTVMRSAMNTTGLGPILATASCKFKFPLTYPDTVLVGVRVGEIGVDRFTMHFRIVSTRHDKVAADGDGVVVSYDYRAGRKAPLPAEWRTAIEALEQAYPALQVDAHSQRPQMYGQTEAALMPVDVFQREFRAALVKAGYDTPDKIIDLVRQVKRDLGAEAGRKV